MDEEILVAIDRCQTRGQRAVRCQWCVGIGADLDQIIGTGTHAQIEKRILLWPFADKIDDAR